MGGSSSSEDDHSSDGLSSDSSSVSSASRFSCSFCSLFQSNHKRCKLQPLCLTLHAFLCKPCFLPKNSWQTALRAGCTGTFICAEHVIYTYVITKIKNMQLRASACIPLYVQHFQVQGEREQTLATISNLSILGSVSNFFAS